VTYEERCRPVTAPRSTPGPVCRPAGLAQKGRPPTTSVHDRTRENPSTVPFHNRSGTRKWVHAMTSEEARQLTDEHLNRLIGFELPRPIDRRISENDRRSLKRWSETDPVRGEGRVLPPSGTALTHVGAPPEKGAPHPKPGHQTIEDGQFGLKMARWEKWPPSAKWPSSKVATS
jgi:hypothetical protein